MTTTSSDGELVAAYATEGSEAAFRGLVTRHVDLVYATALRQVGDPGIAEEVTQNVFVALARKAPRLGGIETLAGWLHRTAVLEAKARIRAELRRKRRHETAAELARIQQEGASALDALAPLLDEALLNLRDADRLALVLRYLEDRSLRDVGAVLGVDEDAARKRVSRATARVAEFFRRRGFAVSIAGGVTAVMTSTATAAPSGLAASAAASALAGGGAATGLNLMLFHVMTLTKTQLAIVCVFIAAAPLAWQWRAEGRVREQQSAAGAQLTAARNRADELEADTRRTQAAAFRTQNEAVAFETRLAALKAQRDGRAPRPAYRWDDNSPVIRVPKQLLGQMPVAAVRGNAGRLTEPVREVLQLTETKAAETQAAMDRFLDAYYGAEAQTLKRVEPEEKDLRGHKPEQTRVFTVQNVNPRLNELRDALHGDLERTLGVERANIFWRGLDWWMPMREDSSGIGGGMAVFNFDRRVHFYEPAPGDCRIWYGVTGADRSLSGTLALDDIPAHYRRHLEDWIALALSQPEKGKRQ